MPDPAKYKDKDEFLEACIPEVEGEGKDHDQAVAQCTSMWKERNKDEGKFMDENKLERRCLPITELRAIKSDDGIKFEGYAAVFNKLSEDLHGFREKIKPGAFKIALKNSDTRALFNHDSNFVLGRKSAGTLKLKEDKKGLYTEIDPPDTQWARDLAQSIERGDINQMSFGFMLEEDKWEETKNGIIRTLVKVKELADISPVTFPAYPDTTVALRSKDKWDEERQAEKETEKEEKSPELDEDNKPEDIREFIDKFLKFAIEQKNILDKFIERFSEKSEPMQAETETDGQRLIQK
jgi:HK97 family phage prohead protease